MNNTRLNNKYNCKKIEEDMLAAIGTVLFIGFRVMPIWACTFVAWLEYHVSHVKLPTNLEDSKLRLKQCIQDG